MDRCDGIVPRQRWQHGCDETLGGDEHCPKGRTLSRNYRQCGPNSSLLYIDDYWCMQRFNDRCALTC